MEKEIAETEVKIKSLSEEMNSGVSDHQRLSELAQQIQALTNQVDEKSLRWMELTELNEA